MLNADEILASLLAGNNVAADLSALRERFEVELEDLADGMKIENLDEDDDADLIAEIEQLNDVIVNLSDAEEFLAEGNTTEAVRCLRALPGNLGQEQVPPANKTFDDFRSATSWLLKNGFSRYLGMYTWQKEDGSATATLCDAATTTISLVFHDEKI